MILGFKDRFVPFVEDGSKTHTIRAGERWRVGMRADLFARPRQKGMRLLFRAPVVRVQPIHIERLPPFGPLRVTVEGVDLSPDELNSFFWRDGFRDEGFPAPAGQAALFWSEQLRDGPFVGQLIHWDYSRRFTDKKARL